MTTANQFGDWVRERLFDLRIKQRDLSRQAEQAGVGCLSPQFINRVLNAGKEGEEVPQWERQTVEKIARALANGKDTFVKEALEVAGYKSPEGPAKRGEKTVHEKDNRSLKKEIECLRNDLKNALATIDRLEDLIETSVGPQAAAWAELESCFGLGDSGDPDASNNDRIDADLARAYADNHSEAA